MSTDNFEGEVSGFETDYIYCDTQFGKPFFLPSVQKVENFKFSPQDIVLAAYPKTGNTWLEEVIWLICNNADVEKSSKTHIMQRFPLMELKYGDQPGFVEMLEQMPPPRFCNSHFPFHMLKDNLEEAKPKVVVLMRNPKDQIVSFWHFYNSYPGRRVEKFNDFFKLFVESRLMFGRYIEHAAGWWKEQGRENFFFLTYEQIKGDHRGYVEKLAKFLEKDLTPEQIDIITEATSMSSMKKRNVSKGAANTDDDGKGAKVKDEGKGKASLGDTAFFRKGIIGDWKNHFSQEQSDIVEKLCRDILEPIGLKFEFE